jgi:hypothetical protein
VDEVDRVVEQVLDRDIPRLGDRSRATEVVSTAEILETPDVVLFPPTMLALGSNVI